MSAYRTAVGFVVAALSGDPELSAIVAGRIFEGVAPATADYPLVTVAAYTDPVDTSYHDARAMTTVDLLVRVWDSSPESQSTSGARSGAAADRADVLLHGVDPVTRPDGSIRSCVRIGEVHSVENRAGSLVRADGGRYRIVVA